MDIQLPGEVRHVLQTLNDAGYEAYIVGGCVRDYFLGHEPNDWDVCTSAKPEQVMHLWPHYRASGLKHGTVTVIICSYPIEITTFRTEGNYSDGRHPDTVEFVGSLVADLGRRDFRINAIAMDVAGKVYDPYGGMKDIVTRTICTVGDPGLRFYEDYLRMMRAIRFACQLGFDIDSKIYATIKQGASNIQKISAERIRIELDKILVSDNPVAGIEWLRMSGLLTYIIPELVECSGFDQHNEHHDKDVLEHQLFTMAAVSPTVPLRLAALVHDIGKPVVFTLDEEERGHFYGHHKVSAEMARVIMHRLKYDRETIDKVCKLVYFHMARYTFLRTNSLKKFITKVGVDNLLELFELMRADRMASRPPWDFSELDAFIDSVWEVVNKKEPLSLRDLAINGDDVMRISGLRPGREIGYILNMLLDKVLDDSQMNTREQLEALISRRNA